MTHYGIETMGIFPGISMDPGIRFGKPYLIGTRIDVATVVGGFVAGETFEMVQEAYQITREQILATLRDAVHVSEQCRRPLSECLEEFLMSLFPILLAGVNLTSLNQSVNSLLKRRIKRDRG